MILLFQPGDSPGPTHTPPMTDLETLKALLSDAETDYQHCIARGDWEQCAAAKAKVARLRNRIGKIIKQRMAFA